MALGLLRGASRPRGRACQGGSCPPGSRAPLASWSSGWRSLFDPLDNSVTCACLSAPRHLSRGELAIQSVLSDTVLCFPKRGSVPRHRKPSAGRGSLLGFQNIPSQESTDIDLPEGLQVPSNSLCLPPTLPSRAVMLAPGVSASEWVLFSRGRFAAVYGADAAPCACLCFGGVRNGEESRAESRRPLNRTRRAAGGRQARISSQ